MNKIPVMVFHQGNPDYLKKTVELAEKNNNEVHLIGDASNKGVSRIWANADEYVPSDYEEFEKAFVQMSDYSLTFDLICFKRFFIMREYMLKNNIDEMVFADSDLLVYTDLSEFYKKHNCKASVSIPARQENYRWTAQAHCSYWTIEYLKSFLEFTLSTYKSNLSILEEKYDYHKANNVKGGVCDMTLLYLWSKDKPDILNTAIASENAVFDHVFARAENYKDSEYRFDKVLQSKKVEFEDKTPYFISEKGERVQALTIHCQGSAKSFIDGLSEYKYGNLSMYFGRYFEAAKRLLKRLGK